MRSSEIARAALRDVLRRPLRNGLATLGVVLATALLVALFSLSAGVRTGLSSRLEDQPLLRMVQVTPASPAAGRAPRPLDDAGIDALSRITGVREALAAIVVPATLRLGDAAPSGTLTGLSVAKRAPYALLAGRALGPLLPVREPVTFTVGAKAGTAVPAQHGLVASYFAGAGYERLDHQQVDPNVDFIWDASDVNPVVSGPDGIDHNDGDFRLPDHWPIWSIAWEGYLEAPVDGTYGLRLHVNNGGWLEMKDSAATLTTVISCPGGAGFEGDCDGSATLTAGRHYIRISYYNNAPSSANAIFSWKRPNDAALSVVPTESLCTQNVAGCASAQRGFIFVHGIRGSHRDRDVFSSVLGRLRDSREFVDFAYFQDTGDFEQNVCRTRDPLIPPETGGLPLTLTTRSLDRTICDSQSDIGLNAALLDQDVRLMQARVGGKVTLIANSMGGAIVRAFLAYAQDARTGGVDAVDAVYFLQGAQQGSHLAYSKPLLAVLAVKEFGPILGPIVFGGAEEIIRDKTGWDATRPAIDDLTPVFSETYRYANPVPAHVPEGVSFINVASEIHIGLDVGLFGYRFRTQGVPLGDYVLLPGSDDPRALPLLGGARFDPGILGRRADHAQYLLQHDLVVRLEAFIKRTSIGPQVQVDFAFPQDLLDIPESHLQLGGLKADGSARMHEISVTERHTGVSKPLDNVLLDETGRQDQR